MTISENEKTDEYYDELFEEDQRKEEHRRMAKFRAREIDKHFLD